MKETISFQFLMNFEIIFYKKGWWSGSSATTPAS
jgi:hypothetical protein